MKRSTQKRIAKLGALLMVLLLVPVLALASFAAETQTVTDPVCYEHGDINGDNSIDGRDAIYTLYHSLFHDINATYPVNQDCDFDGDGDVDSDDAVFVLYGSMGIFDDYTLNGTVHKYYAPQWTWSEDLSEASVVFQCGCGQIHSYDAESGVSVTVTSSEATCIDAGVVTYTAAVTFEDTEYTSVRTQVSSASGHQMTGVQSCTEGSVCDICGYTLAALDHSWQLVEEIEATCVAQGTLHYTCQRESCEETLTVTPEGLANHSFTTVFEETHVEGCQYRKQYQCAHCDATAEGEIFYKHVYTAVLTAEATCSADGLMTYTCDCGDSYETTVTDANAHSWVAGETDENGITSYTCEYCGATKTALCQDGSEATVTSAALKESELQLSGAIVELDDSTVDALAEEVTISVETAAVEELSLTAEQAAQIGDNTVYDFSMVSGEEQVSEFAGEVTVSIPYTLQEGDDAECIDVWFIADDGTVTCVEGTYSAGYVTFTTDHFSYYTVTRLTVAQRCEYYGHVMVEDRQDATCTQAGHYVKSCKRCGIVETDETVEKLAHTYESAAEGNTAATCLESGTYAKICTVCKQSFTGEVPATGHDWVLDESQSTAVSCTEAGKQVYVCAHDCGETYTETLSALGHQFADGTTTEPDCTNMGYTARTCQNCQQTFNADELAPLGHAYEVSGWSWAEDYSSAAITLVCSNDASHTKTLEAVITATVEAPNCTGTGEKTYTAVASYNLVTYEDTAVETLAEAGHQAGETWMGGDNQHYKLCAVCGEKIDAAAHSWTSTVTVQAADCINAGLIRQTCGVCGYELESVVPATGEHSYEDGVCTVCGFRENSCDHLRMYKEDIDLSGYDICDGTVLTLSHCDCGQAQTLMFQLNCSFNYDNTTATEQTLPDGSTYTLYTDVCEDCGLVWEHTSYYELLPEACILQFYSNNRFSMDGVTIVEAKETIGDMTYQHSPSFKLSSVDMASLGMCGGEIVTYTCYCGERTVTYMEESQCIWYYDSENSTNDLRLFSCAACGTHRTLAQTSSERGTDCSYTYTNTHVFTRNGAQIYTFSSTETYIEHNYVTTDVTMYGATCEDGVMISSVCNDCGEEYRYYADYHPMLEKAVYQLSDYGLCGGKLGQRECPCGQEMDYYYWPDSSGNSCDFDYVDTNSLGFERYKCDDCGGYYLEKQTTGSKDANCTYENRNIRTQYSPDGILIVTVNEVWPTTSHNYSYDFVMKGTSCEDGVKITYLCDDCGYSHIENVSHHVDLKLNSYNFADYGMCDGTFTVWGCPCGYYSNINNDNSCDWTYDHEDENGNDVYICEDCGVTETFVQGEPVNLGGCRYQTPVTITYARDGETVLQIAYSETESNHHFIWNLTLREDADSCEDGYTGIGTCQTCGQTSHTSGEDHENWPIARKVISTGLLCGDLEQVTYGCACGEEQHQQEEWFGGECVFSGEYEYGDAWAADCAVCGVTRQRVYTETRGEDCDYSHINTYTYVKNGVTLFTYANTDTYKEHTYVYTFEMNGDTCEDGYYAYGTCAFCGVDWESGYNDVCDSYQTDVEVLYEGSDVCGRILLTTWDCPCGDSYYQQIEDFCNWDWIGWEDSTEMELYKCSDCGADRYESYRYTSVAGSCDEIHTMHYIYEQDGEIVNLERQFTGKQHQYIYTYSMDGESCADGYTATGSCYYCGKTTSYRSDSHNTEMIRYYDLSKYGMCGGFVQYSSCACGKHSDYGYNNTCSWSYTGKTDSEGRDEAYCSNCETYRYFQEVVDRDYANCITNLTYRSTYVRDGETVLDLTLPAKMTSHIVVAESFEMQGNTCEDGYYINWECAFCDYGYRGYDSDHYTHTVEIANLDSEAPGSCGGILQYEKCPCGQETGLSFSWDCSSSDELSDSWSETDEDGNTHWFYSNTCAECGMNWVQEECTVTEKDSCVTYTENIYTFSFGDSFRKTFETGYIWNDHIYSITGAVLQNGSESCIDGILITYTCDYCGDSFDSYGAHHEMMVTDSIDLSQYGSVCGGKLNHYACLCGERQQYDLDDELQCDMGRYSTPVWIDGYVTDSQYTTEGYTGTYSNAYLMTCAVTDPACAMQIRMAEYWLVEDCIATEYQTWQLGYDSDTNTWQKEITVATGYDTHAYHNYETSGIDETPDDSTSVNGTLYTCVDCGSSYSTKTYFTESGVSKYEEEAFNTLDNDERKYWHQITEYDLVANGYRYQTLSRNEYTYADGSDYWYQYAYTYDFDNGCKQTEVYTNSNGESYVYYGTAHRNGYTYTTIRESTCSQYGEFIEHYACNVCDTLSQEYTYTEEPTDHSWVGSDEEGYICEICGMENANGASGSIVLEELTTPSDYAVGYWNRGNIQFTTYVSVFLENVTEGEEELLLDVDYSEITEKGIVGYTFNKSDATSAAYAAMDAIGYTGTFAIRFTFVPVNAEDTLDYAITFESLSRVPA